jgi:hypothetical protein
MVTSSNWSESVVMRRAFSVAAVGLLTALSSSSSLQAQNTARLRVSVNVVPAVTVRTVPPSPIITDVPQEVQFSWGAKQHSHVMSRTAKSSELDGSWLKPANPCGPEGTKVLSVSPKPTSCDITINTVEFIIE